MRVYYRITIVLLMFALLTPVVPARAQSSSEACTQLRAAKRYLEEAYMRCVVFTSDGRQLLDPMCVVGLGFVSGTISMGTLLTLAEIRAVRATVFPRMAREVLGRYRELLSRRQALLAEAGYRGELGLANVGELNTLEAEMGTLETQLHTLRQVGTRLGRNVAETLSQIRAVVGSGTAPASTGASEATTVARVQRELLRRSAGEAMADGSDLAMRFGVSMSGGLAGVVAAATGAVLVDTVFELAFPASAGAPTEATVDSVLAHPEVLLAAPVDLACRYLESFASVRAAVAPVVAEVRATAERAAERDARVSDAADALGYDRSGLGASGPVLSGTAATVAIGASAVR